MEKQVKYYTIVADFGADGTATFMITEDKAIAEETFKQLQEGGEYLAQEAFNSMPLENADKIHFCEFLEDETENIIQTISLWKNDYDKELNELHAKFDKDTYCKETVFPFMVNCFNDLKKVLRKAKTLENVVIALKSSSQFDIPVWTGEMDMSIPDMENHLKEVVSQVKKDGLIKVMSKYPNAYITYTIQVQGDNSTLDKLCTYARYENQTKEVFENMNIDMIYEYLEDILVDNCNRKLAVGEDIYHIFSSPVSGKICVGEGTITELFPLTQRIKVKWADPPAEESTVKAHNCVKKFVIK